MLFFVFVCAGVGLFYMQCFISLPRTYFTGASVPGAVAADRADQVQHSATRWRCRACAVYH